MKAIILAGGRGERLNEETTIRPKPMVEIGGKPILWHLLKGLSSFGINDFILCCGYKGYVIKEYFVNYFLHSSDITIGLDDNSLTVHERRAEPWKITLVDTGVETMTGGRLLRVKKYVQEESSFFFTYGDGIGNIDIYKLSQFHNAHEGIATVTAVYPPGRFGALKMEDNKVIDFSEKPRGDNSLINGGFFILDQACFEYIEDDLTSWEEHSLKLLAQRNQLNGYHHNGFWHPMDTQRDKKFLEHLWETGNPPWKTWND